MYTKRNRFHGIIKFLGSTLCFEGRNWICVGIWAWFSENSSGMRNEKKKNKTKNERKTKYNDNDIALVFQWHRNWMIQLVKPEKKNLGGRGGHVKVPEQLNKIIIHVAAMSFSFGFLSLCHKIRKYEFYKFVWKFYEGNWLWVFWVFILVDRILKISFKNFKELNFGTFNVYSQFFWGAFKLNI